jgi:hypothetical protein
MKPLSTFLTLKRRWRREKDQKDVESSAPQNIKIKAKGKGWGGSRGGSGRPQRRPSPWPKDTDLSSSIGVDRFLRSLIKQVWRENPLDARAVGALNNTLRLLLDLRGWTKSGYSNVYEKDPVERGSDENSDYYGDDEEEPTEEEIEEGLREMEEWRDSLTPEQRQAVVDRVLKRFEQEYGKEAAAKMREEAERARSAALKTREEQPK